MKKEVLKLVDYLYGANKPPNEPKYKRRGELIDRACTIYGKYGEHLKADLQPLWDGYQTKNKTDWNYDHCFSFLVLLHKGVPYHTSSEARAIQLVEKLGGTADSLSLQISAMGPYYTYSFIRRIYDNSCQEFVHQVSEQPFHGDHKIVLKQVIKYCESKGFKRLNKKLLNQTVPGITLDLADEEGKVTVYNCIFMDLPPD